jgi:putative peptide maturation dehydrogenase
MPRVRRTAYVFFFCRDYGFLEIDRLLRGELAPCTLTQLSALSILTGAEVPITVDELALAQSIPADEWIDLSDQAEVVRSLAERGILVTDDEGEPFAALRARDENVSAVGWNAYAALYHFFTRWSDVDLREGTDDPHGELPPITADAVDAFLEVRGVPPPAFHAIERPVAVRKLPPATRAGGLYEALANRRTTRAFDLDEPVTVEELATLLHHVFGCHGYSETRPELVTLKRTSPSGGGLHPVEAYPLVSNVAGLEPGLYHYRSRDHALELIEPLSARDARALATQIVVGQTYFGSAHVLFLLTARFARNHWKYRNHQKAYAVMLMDVGHLSQTLYLVSTELGLGAFVTAAANTALIDERLGLDGCAEGALAVAGCGRPAAERSAFDPVFEPFEAHVGEGL